MSIQRRNLVGLTFGRWTAIAPAPRYRWRCVCECGTERRVNTSALLTGRSRSCGCLHREIFVRQITKHGRARSPEYKAWTNAKNRCENPRNPLYRHYGARGIFMAPVWRDDFSRFLSDVGSRPSPKHSIDRIDNDGPYGPGNCRWVLQSDQTRNTRRSRWITHAGETRCLVDWADHFGIDRCTFRQRLRRGLSLEEAANQIPRIDSHD